MLLRLILIGIIAYWGAKAIRGLISPSSEPKEGGTRKSGHDEPLDLSNYDIEDADFEELDE
ncbi:hypothetical protein JW960_13185 [candidate division KSB1 bacterium]|nr:hypothetical protein [candidate division KSB1 bacterium]